MCCSADLGANIMGTKDDIEAAVAKIFKSTWTTRNGTKVPEQSDIGLGNDGVLIEGTILYADLDGSTAMVDKYTKEFSAEIYKAYLDSTARIIRSENGEIVSFDGDRIMAVFIGDSKNTRAVRCGLKINYSVKHLVMPALITQYPKVDFKIKHVVGIDTSPLLVARTGIRGSNDLVWVGPAANYAAKLTELSSDYPTWITHRVFDKMSDDVKSSSGTSMWEPRTWTPMNNLSIYRSTWWWRVN